MMKWGYKTVHFELKKEGLLGGAFLDETEIEEELNEFGRSGWELVSVFEVQDGVIAIFKQPLGRTIDQSADNHGMAQQELFQPIPDTETGTAAGSRKVSRSEREDEQIADEPVSSSTIGAIKIE